VSVSAQNGHFGSVAAAESVGVIIVAKGKKEEGLQQHSSISQCKSKFCAKAVCLFVLVCADHSMFFLCHSHMQMLLLLLCDFGQNKRRVIGEEKSHPHSFLRWPKKSTYFFLKFPLQ
jgi:hypothetical protein